MTKNVGRPIRTKVHGGYMIRNGRRDRDRDGPEMVLELPIPFMCQLCFIYLHIIHGRFVLLNTRPLSRFPGCFNPHIYLNDFPYILHTNEP